MSSALSKKPCSAITAPISRILLKNSDVPQCSMKNLWPSACGKTWRQRPSISSNCFALLVGREQLPRTPSAIRSRSASSRSFGRSRLVPARICAM